MTTTTFKQIVGKETLTITVPVTRVERILGRVDDLIEAGKIKRAKNILAPFVVATPSKTKQQSNLSADEIVEKYRARGRSEVVKQLVAAGATRPSAYYRVKKAGL